MFPLNTVLYPGVVTSLHIFEDRYRTMMSDLMAIADPADRVFGVVAIREGYEVGDHGMQSAHRVGTLVQVTEHELHDDGTWDIQVTGRQRLRLDDMDTSGEYLVGEVELLDDVDEVIATDDVDRTHAVFARYREELGSLRGGPVMIGALPHDPAYLGYALAATCLLTLDERQLLLEAETAVDRLALLRQLLREELRTMRAVPSLPAMEVARTRWSPN